MKIIALIIFLWAITFFNSAIAQTTYFQEDFNSGLPATWQVITNGVSAQPWDTTSYFDDGTNPTFSFDNTLFMHTWDAAPFAQAQDTLVSPSFSVSAFGGSVYLIYDYYYIPDSSTTYGAFVDVYDGSSWHNVKLFQGVDTLGTDSIDISSYANANFKIQFRTQNDLGIISLNAFLIDNVKVIDPTLTSITEKNSPSFSIYPNPVRNTISMKNINPDEISSIEIYSIEGSFIKSCKNKLEIYVSDLEYGTYILRVNSEENSLRKLFIKQ